MHYIFYNQFVMNSLRRRKDMQHGENNHGTALTVPTFTMLNNTIL